MMKACLLGLNLLTDVLRFVVLNLRSRNSLATENLFLRKQLAFYQDRRIKPRRTSDQVRLTLLWLSRWFAWRSAMTLVTPRTFIGWHRSGFEFYWRRKCQLGRPPTPPDLQRLIHQMGGENPSWARSASPRAAIETRAARVTAHRVRGRWCYLYRAIDSTCTTIDFLLSVLRDAAAAKRLFRLALSDPSHPQPRVINTDQARLYGAAIAAVKAEGTLRRRCRHRPVQYLNNILEQDHRAIKRRVQAKQSFREFRAAGRTIAGTDSARIGYGGKAGCCLVMGSPARFLRPSAP